MENTSLSLRACACTLGRAFGYKPLAARRLVTELGGDPRKLFAMPQKERFERLGAFSPYRNALSDAAYGQSVEELAKLPSLGWDYIAMGEEGWPKLLEECPDAPMGLYYRSDTAAAELFRPERGFIAVVGTRDISENGISWCRRVVASLAQAENRPVIVSGLAYGADTAAHTAALELGLPSIAVLPCGPGEIYPRGNQHLSQRLSKTPLCALVSDFPPGTMVQKVTFQKRNRIIAGLSSATIVIESREKGGSLITARLAAGYGRDVYALPGRVDDPRSRGCNLLLREQCAEAVCDIADLPQRLGLTLRGQMEGDKLERRLILRYKGENETALKAAALIRRNPSIDIEQLAERLSLPFSEAARTVGMLEADGFVRTDLFGRCRIEERIAY